MAPNQPCTGCKHQGRCNMESLNSYLAIVEWLKDSGFECADYDAEYYHGIEGVRV